MFSATVYLFLYSLLAAIFSNAAPVDLVERVVPPASTVIDWDFQERPSLTGLTQTNKRPLVSFSGIWKVNPVDGVTQVPDNVLNGMAKYAYSLMTSRFKMYETQGKMGNRNTAPAVVSVAQFGEYLYFASSVSGDRPQYDAAFPEPAGTLIRTKELLYDGKHAEPNYVRLWLEHNNNAIWPGTPTPKTSAWGWSRFNNRAEFLAPCSTDHGNCATFLQQLDPRVTFVVDRTAVEWTEARQWLGQRMTNKRWGPAPGDDGCSGDDGGNGGSGGDKRPASSGPGGESDPKKPANQARAAKSSSVLVCTRKLSTTTATTSATSTTSVSKSTATKPTTTSSMTSSTKSSSTKPATTTKAKNTSKPATTTKSKSTSKSVAAKPTTTHAGKSAGTSPTKTPAKSLSKPAAQKPSKTPTSPKKGPKKGSKKGKFF